MMENLSLTSLSLPRLELEGLRRIELLESKLADAESRHATIDFKLAKLEASVKGIRAGLQLQVTQSKSSLPSSTQVSPVDIIAFTEQLLALQQELKQSMGKEQELRQNLFGQLRADVLQDLKGQTFKDLKKELSQELLASAIRPCDGMPAKVSPDTADEGVQTTPLTLRADENVSLTQAELTTLAEQLRKEVEHFASPRSSLAEAEGSIEALLSDSPRPSCSGQEVVLKSEVERLFEVAKQIQKVVSSKSLTKQASKMLLRTRLTDLSSKSTAQIKKANAETRGQLDERYKALKQELTSLIEESIGNKSELVRRDMACTSDELRQGLHSAWEASSDLRKDMVDRSNLLRQEMMDFVERSVSRESALVRADLACSSEGLREEFRQELRAVLQATGKSVAEMSRDLDDRSSALRHELLKIVERSVGGEIAQARKDIANASEVLRQEVQFELKKALQATGQASASLVQEIDNKSGSIRHEMLKYLERAVGGESAQLRKDLVDSSEVLRRELRMELQSETSSERAKDLRSANLRQDIISVVEGCLSSHAALLHKEWAGSLEALRKDIQQDLRKSTQEDLQSTVTEACNGVRNNVLTILEDLRVSELRWHEQHSELRRVQSDLSVLEEKCSQIRKEVVLLEKCQNASGGVKVDYGHSWNDQLKALCEKTCEDFMARLESSLKPRLPIPEEPHPKDCFLLAIPDSSASQVDSKQVGSQDDKAVTVEECQELCLSLRQEIRQSVDSLRRDMLQELDATSTKAAWKLDERTTSQVKELSHLSTRVRDLERKVSGLMLEIQGIEGELSSTVRPVSQSTGQHAIVAAQPPTAMAERICGLEEGLTAGLQKADDASRTALLQVQVLQNDISLFEHWLTEAMATSREAAVQSQELRGSVTAIEMHHTQIAQQVHQLNREATAGKQGLNMLAVLLETANRRLDDAERWLREAEETNCSNATHGGEATWPEATEKDGPAVSLADLADVLNALRDLEVRVDTLCREKVESPRRQTPRRLSETFSPEEASLLAEEESSFGTNAPGRTLAAQFVATALRNIREERPETRDAPPSQTVTQSPIALRSGPNTPSR